jgi:hypothetical protein
MQTLRQLCSEQRSSSFIDVSARYSTQSLRELIEADGSPTAFNYEGYLFERTATAIRVSNKAGEKTEFELNDTPITDEQRQQILDKAWEDIRKFVTDKFEDLKSGKITAADIGGALYGSVAGAIVFVLAPFAKLGPLADVLVAPFVGLAANRGRYFGAVVDELVAVLKKESELTQRDILGVLGTTAVVASYFVPVIQLVPLGGTTAWELTVGIGKWVGGAVEDALDEIAEAVPPVGVVLEAVGDAAEDVIAFLGKIF